MKIKLLIYKYLILFLTYLKTYIIILINNRNYQIICLHILI